MHLRTEDRSDGSAGDQVTYSFDSGTAWITLARPEKLNALTLSMSVRLEEFFAQAESDGARAVVLTGTGRAFCVGSDLGGVGVVLGDPERIEHHVELGSRVYDVLRSLPMPTVACVNGLALAGGLELMLACDIVIAADTAMIGDGHANYGMLPGGGGLTHLARIVGLSAAKYLLFTGRSLPALAWQQLGLIARVVPAADLRSETRLVVADIVGKSAECLRAMKRLTEDCYMASAEDANAMVRSVVHDYLQSPDAAEGIAAFEEGRTPQFG